MSNLRITVRFQVGFKRTPSSSQTRREGRVLGRLGHFGMAGEDRVSFEVKEKQSPEWINLHLCGLVGGSVPPCRTMPHLNSDSPKVPSEEVIFKVKFKAWI